VRGTVLEGNSPPNIAVYRRIQLASFLIVNGKTTLKKMSFDGHGKIVNFGLPFQDLESLITSGTPFQTSGCKNCNRPYYNEKPSGPIYNYPKKPSAKEIKKIKEDLGY
jgi:biotin synthase